MGLTIKCKKTGTSYSLGYFGMAKLRMRVAELCCPEFGAAYEETYKKAERAAVSFCLTILKRSEDVDCS